MLDSGSAMAASDPSSHIIMTESEMEKLSALLTDTFQGQILTLVNGIVDGVLKGIQDNISEVEKKNQELVIENQELRKRVDLLERKCNIAAVIICAFLGSRNCH